MKSFLLPNRYKKLGWLLVVPAFIAGFIFMVLQIKLQYEPTISVFGLFGDGFQIGKDKQTLFRVDKIDLIPNLTGLCLLIGGMLVMFSKEKKEDEFINQIRLNALQFSVFINYALLFICFIFIHSLAFFQVMVYNMFTVIIFYILRFHYLLFNNSISRNEQ